MARIVEKPAAPRRAMKKFSSHPDTTNAHEMNSPNNKVALVTGAAKRLGRAIALGLAQDGWDIVVHYRESAAEAEATVSEIISLGRASIALPCDLSNEADTLSLIQRANEQLGPVRCVVNSASLFDYDDAHSFGHAQLDAHMRCNLAAPLLLAKTLHATTPDGEQAVVINLLDQKLYNLNPDFLSYTLSKAALQTAISMLATALAPKLRVVGLAPGLTMISGDQSPEGFDKAHRQTVLGKGSTPEDIAQAACYLASARGVTGTTLLVDGGQHLVPLNRDVMFITK
jgi:NAD(P)-dependent dehydrogenase (short-subunit alcohol dehydrogenase family)